LIQRYALYKESILSDKNAEDFYQFVSPRPDPFPRGEGLKSSLINGFSLIEDFISGYNDNEYNKGQICSRQSSGMFDFSISN